MLIQEVTVWVLIDANGNAVSDCNPEHLRDEYEADFDGPLNPATPTRLVKLTLAVPLPRPVEIRGTVPDEVCAGELV